MPLATASVMQNTDETAMKLVASLLENLQKSVLQGVTDIAAVRSQMAEQGATIDKIHGEVRATNGKVIVLRNEVNELVTWRDGVQSEDEQAASYAAGVKAVRDGDRALIRRVWARIERWVITGGAVVAGAAGERIFRLLEGGLW